MIQPLILNVKGFFRSQQETYQLFHFCFSELKSLQKYIDDTNKRLLLDEDLNAVQYAVLESFKRLEASISFDPSFEKKCYAKQKETLCIIYKEVEIIESQFHNKKKILTDTVDIAETFIVEQIEHSGFFQLFALDMLRKYKNKVSMNFGIVDSRLLFCNQFVNNQVNVML